MRTLPILPALMLLTLLFTSPALHAAEPARATSADELELAVERALNRHVVFPLLERKHDMTGEVTVSFVANSEGRLEVTECWSANEPLRPYVLSKLAKVDVGDNPGGIWRTTRVHFVFRPEKA